MKIKLKETVKIGNKFYTTDSTIDVINEIGMSLIVNAKAFCVDGTFGNNVKYEPAKQIGTNAPKQKVTKRNKAE